ncbi:hypothetical protein SCLCIDRAFT_1179123 [Scleroderma citrinum Foug A]|uniref:Uncharacterized protein n=1 Tax=Scleroderma citrinum Foug A TaxID=1036808 RepID=A0A0C2ZJL6_9AGAM|nr:hypothetical protein SCLCIDRAFT_1179123 [Scleroderma citrinum Foug A]
MSHMDCFIISGSKVHHCRSGHKKQIMMVGSVAGIIPFTGLMILFFVQLGMGNLQQNVNQNGMAFAQILIMSVTLVVVAVHEGLSLAVTLVLVFTIKCMTKENLVCILSSCETMTNVSVICTNKTGILSQNTMSRDDFSIDLSQLNMILSPQLQKLFDALIVVNSMAFKDEDPGGEKMVSVGSEAETALLSFAKELQWMDFGEGQNATEVIQMIPCSTAGIALTDRKVPIVGIEDSLHLDICEVVTDYHRAGVTVKIVKNQDAKSEIDEPKKIITELWSAWKNALAEIKEKHKQEKMTLMMANLTLVDGVIAARWQLSEEQSIVWGALDWPRGEQSDHALL